MTDKDIRKIGDEMVRVVTPVYQELGLIKKDIVEIKKTLAEHSDKIDALTVEVHDIHQELGGYKDKIDSELEKIKIHVNFPPSV